MRRAYTDLRFEGCPPLLKFIGSPFVPTRVDELGPSNIVFCIKVQGCNSKYAIRLTQMESCRYILVDEDF